MILLETICKKSIKRVAYHREEEEGVGTGKQGKKIREKTRHLTKGRTQTNFYLHPNDQCNILEHHRSESNTHDEKPDHF